MTTTKKCENCGMQWDPADEDEDFRADECPFCEESYGV